MIGIAQPSLTRQVKLLEQEVGVPLIARSGRGAEPTEEGKYLLSKSVEHLSGLDKAIRDLRQGFSKVEGQVSLGMCPTIAPFFRSQLEKWIATTPNSSLSIIEAYSGDLKSLMDGDRLDLALTYKPGKAGDGVVTKLFSERLAVVAGYSSDREERILELRDLLALNLILPSRIHELRRIIDRVCQRHGVFLRPDMELDSLDAVKALLMEPRLNYHTILPARSVVSEVAARQLIAIPMGSTEMMRTIVIMERGGKRPPIVSMLHNKIVDLAREIGALSDCLA